MNDPAQTEEQLALLLADLTDRAQRGEAIDIGGVCTQHPQLAEELRQLWGAVMVAEVAGSNSHADASSNSHESPSGILELPCQFGDYELLEEIGRGGMGVVYRARQLSLGREVAMKMILRGQIASPAERERFQAEAEAAARIDHPGIVPVYEVGESQGRSYFCMKLVPGVTLSHRLAEGPLPPREAARLVADVSRAIHAAHLQGVLHRDLKPSNILLDEQGQPHITDFGLAKQFSGDAASLTKTGAILGTPAYMAPEQAAGSRGQMSPKSDVYSLGSVLYHALTGRPPFQAASPVDTVLLVLEQDPAPPRLLNPRVDRDLEMIVLKCLQKPADLRYNSAAALADDLQAYLNDEPVSARSGRLTQIATWFRETHNAPVLENWGLLWMWHSLALFIACFLTNALYWYGVENRYYYFALWTAGLGAWATVFWALRHRMGPVMFVERQIAHVWAGSMICIALLFPLEWWLGLKVLTLSPMLGLINGMAFLVKAGILSGAFYVQAGALFLTAGAMAIWPNYAHLIFGTVSAGCFFFPGLKYYRQRSARE